MEHGRLAASAPSCLPSTCQRTQNKAALAVRSSLVLPLIAVSPVSPPLQGCTFQSAEQEFHQPHPVALCRLFQAEPAVRKRCSRSSSTSTSSSKRRSCCQRQPAVTYQSQRRRHQAWSNRADGGKSYDSRLSGSQFFSPFSPATGLPTLSPNRGKRVRQPQATYLLVISGISRDSPRNHSGCIDCRSHGRHTRAIRRPVPHTNPEKRRHFDETQSQDRNRPSGPHAVFLARSRCPKGYRLQRTAEDGRPVTHSQWIRRHELGQPPLHHRRTQRWHTERGCSSFTSTAETMSAADLNQPFHVLGMAVVGLANTTLTLHALQP